MTNYSLYYVDGNNTYAKILENTHSFTIIGLSKYDLGEITFRFMQVLKFIIFFPFSNGNFIICTDLETTNNYYHSTC